MSKSRTTALHRQVEKRLKALGVDYQIVPGSKHRKLYVGGRMIMVFSNTSRPKDAVGLEKMIRKITDAHC